MSRTILISGAAAGLGLAFLEAYLSDPSSHIVAIDKSPLPHDLAKGHQARLRYFQVDVTSEQSVHDMIDALGKSPIDLVIHSAGVRGLVPEVEDDHPGDVAACETLQVMNAATLMRTFQVNAVGTFTLLHSLLSNLKQSAGSKVIVMSSRMGSLGHNTAGSAYAYRASKAALNAMVRSLSIDVPDVSFILCHPGRVETSLVRCKEDGAISAEDSVEGLLPLIERWDKSDSGKFYDRFGAPIVW